MAYFGLQKETGKQVQKFMYEMHLYLYRHEHTQKETCKNETEVIGRKKNYSGDEYD